jgi:hypothetical protein
MSNGDSVYRSPFGDFTAVVEKVANKNTTVEDDMWSDAATGKGYSFFLGRMVVPDGFYLEKEPLVERGRWWLNRFSQSEDIGDVTWGNAIYTTFQTQKALKISGTFTFQQKSSGRYTLYVVKKNSLIYYLMGFSETDTGQKKLSGVLASLRWTGKMPKASQPETAVAQDGRPPAKRGYHWASTPVYCGSCSGRGHQTCSNCGGSTRDYHGKPCTWCYGSGKSGSCYTCSGTGQQQQWVMVPD